MALEIERKFLVDNDAWLDHCVRKERLIDGLLATSRGRKVRVRIYETRATIAIKTGRKGRVREEFEYAIPLPDAERLIANECGGDVIVKMRHYVPHRGFMWEVDVYEGVLAGVVIGELELKTEKATPPLPSWVGREVTDDPLYRKSSLRARARAARGDTRRTVATAADYPFAAKGRWPSQSERPVADACAARGQRGG